MEIDRSPATRVAMALYAVGAYVLGLIPDEVVHEVRRRIPLGSANH